LLALDTLISAKSSATLLLAERTQEHDFSAECGVAQFALSSTLNSAACLSIKAPSQSHSRREREEAKIIKVESVSAEREKHTHCSTEI
jgi:hypothetical protein